MVYNYSDEFLIRNVDNLEEIESKAIEEVEKLNVVDAFYKEKLVTSLVYMNIAKEKLEADGAMDKYKIYEKEFNRYLSLAKSNSSVASVGSVEIRRG